MSEISEEKEKQEVTLWAVATGGVDVLNRESRRAAKFISKLHGFIAIHPVDYYHILWLFDTENNAKVARNKMEAKDIICGKNICPVYVDQKYLN